MFKKGLPVGAIVVLLIVALAAIGVGYGLWAKTLTISGTVRTGELNAILSVEEVDESYSFNDICPSSGGYSIGKDCDLDGNLNDDWEAEDKDVAECVAALDEKDPAILYVTITNGYPSFNCFVQFNVKNTGTIPVKVEYPAAYAWDGAVWVLLTGGAGFGGNYGQAQSDYIYHLNSWPPTISEQTCYLDDTQLHRGEKALCNLHFHLGQLAEMGTTYYFKVEAFVHQWNEEP